MKVYEVINSQFFIIFTRKTSEFQHKRAQKLVKSTGEWFPIQQNTWMVVFLTYDVK